MGKYDKQLDRMLARGRLSPNELDRVVERAMASDPAAAEGRKRRLGLRWALVPALSFGVVASLFLVITNPFSSAEFRSSRAAAVALAVECEAPCESGSELRVRVGAHRQAGFLSVYASSGERSVWLFPPDAGEATRLDPSEQDLALAAHIVALPGDYVVRAVLTSEVLSREAILALPPGDERIVGDEHTAIRVAESPSIR
jgi:hypothetical protein